MRKIGLFLFLFFPALLLEAQDWKRTAIWYFGQNAGLDFNTTPPTPLTDGQINTIEGCATISDTAGNLVMYTDGHTVWNKNHQIMVNGTGLLGDASSTQAALIIPFPEIDSMFYLFTTDASAGQDGLRYSLININYAGGQGEVIEKNVLLVAPVAEKLVAVKHRDNKAYWVIAHEINSNRFISYYLGKNGIIECPVFSSVGSTYTSFNAIGSLKIANDGETIASSTWLSQSVDFFSFNRETGLLTDKFQIKNLSFPYGIEFSADNNKVFISERDNLLLCFDLSSNVESTINASKQILFGPYNNLLYYLQIANNELIYCALNDTSRIGVIENWNGKDTFIISGMDLFPGKSMNGLPNFVSSYFHQPSINFSYSLDCSLNSIALTEYDTIGATDFTWKIIQESSGLAESTSSDRNPSFQFQDTGWYTIKLVASNGSQSDSVSKTIHIKPKYVLNLGNDTTLCDGQTLLLDAGGGQHCYVWQDSSMGTTLIADTAGTYWVKVTTNNFCTCYDSISVSYTPYPSKPQITRGNDTLFADTGYSYQWYRNGLVLNGATDPYYHFSSNGEYQVEVRNESGCGILSDSFSVTNVSVRLPIEKGHFTLYPNPSAQGNDIHIKGTEMIESIRVIDYTGKQVFEQNTIQDFHYRLQLPYKGTYIIIINGSIHYQIMIT